MNTNALINVPIKEATDTIKEVAGFAYEGLSLVFPALPGWVAERRAKCLVEVLIKTQDILSKANLKEEQLRHCSLKLGVPIIENASLEEEPSLQELWARLLANALNPNFDDEIRPLFADVIKQLSSFDAMVLCALARKEPYRLYLNYDRSKLRTGQGYIDVQWNSLQGSFAILAALSLIDNTKESVLSLMNHRQKYLEKADYKLTSFGRLFVRACIDAPDSTHITSRRSENVKE